MFRKSVRVASRIAVSAAISWTLIPIAIADAPAPTPLGGTPAAAPQAGAPSGKRLFTVPEDGMGDTHWLSGATRAVREIMLKRPNEDRRSASPDASRNRIASSTRSRQNPKQSGRITT